MEDLGRERSLVPSSAILKKGPDVTQLLRETHAILVQNKVHYSKNRLPPEFIVHTEEEGDIAPPEG